MSLPAKGKKRHGSNIFEFLITKTKKKKTSFNIIRYCEVKIQVSFFLLIFDGIYRTGISDIADSFGDLDDSAMDAEGPAALMYRYSRRKSDSKSDENSQNSKRKETVFSVFLH